MIKTILTFFGIALLVMTIGGLFVASTFDEEFKDTPSFNAEIENCRVLKTEFVKSHYIYAFKKKLYFRDNWQVSVFNIKAKKIFLLNFSQNPKLVKDSIYKFVTLY